MITFGLTPARPSDLSKTGEDFDVDSSLVWDLLDDLRYRSLTGNAAKSAVADLCARLSFASEEIIWRILSKDLRCGMTGNTVNRVMPGTVPIFSVMLAHKFDEDRVKNFPVAVEPKLDGLRVIGLVRGRECKFFSRTGKHFPALDHLGPDVIKMVTSAFEMASASDSPPAVLFRKMLGDTEPSLAIDAEVISGSFNKTSGDVRRKSDAARDAQLFIFDAVPHHFMTGESKAYGMEYSARRTFIEFLVAHAPIWARIDVTKMRLVETSDEIHEIYAEYRSAGLEGAMVKSLNGLYHKARSHGWMKMKAIESEDLLVVGAFEGSGKYEHSLGGLIVDRAGVEVRVGGGFSDAQREEIWRDWSQDQSRILDRLIEVEFHEATEDGSLRHPRFVGFRDDKDERVAA
jgi:DNA ligase-1